MTTVLVTYATKAGSTIGVAEQIARALRSDGFTVTLHKIEKDLDPTPYDAVVIGSAIRVGSWLPPAVNFVEQHASVLANRPVAFFSVCMTLHEDTPEHRDEVYGYTAPVRQMLTPQAEGFFAGSMDYGLLSFPVRMLIKRIGVPEGDYRDWNTIDMWARALKPIFTPQPEALR